MCHHRLDAAGTLLLHTQTVPRDKEVTMSVTARDQEEFVAFHVGQYDIDAVAHRAAYVDRLWADVNAGEFDENMEGEDADPATGTA
jgi:hypothetical protein